MFTGLEHRTDQIYHMDARESNRALRRRGRRSSQQEAPRYDLPAQGGLIRECMLSPSLPIVLILTGFLAHHLPLCGARRLRQWSVLPGPGAHRPW